MFLSVVVPAYNEERRLAPSLETIYNFLKDQDYKSEIVVVDDGSTDSTRQLMEEFHKTHKSSDKVEVVALGYLQNRGKGYAVKVGVLAAKGKHIYLCDCDLSTPIEELSKFLEYGDEYDIVIGSRAHKKSKVRTSFIRKALGRVGNRVINTFLVKDITDTQAGFKLFNNKVKELFSKQKIERWGFDIELLYLAQRKGFKIVEIPVEWNNKEFSKVKPIHYVTTLFEMLKILFNKYK